ncbi:MAG: hypothetical protein WHX52_07240 [Anaerolineae bacterium]
MHPVLWTLTPVLCFLRTARCPLAGVWGQQPPGAAGEHTDGEIYDEIHWLGPVSDRARRKAWP